MHIRYKISGKSLLAQIDNFDHAKFEEDQLPDDESWVSNLSVEVSPGLYIAVDLRGYTHSHEGADTVEITPARSGKYIVVWVPAQDDSTDSWVSDTPFTLTERRRSEACIRALDLFNAMFSPSSITEF